MGEFLTFVNLIVGLFSLTILLYIAWSIKTGKMTITFTERK